MKYQIAVKPNFNIAFFDKYLEMCQVEIRTVLAGHGIIMNDVKIVNVNKAKMLTFEVDQPIEIKALKAIWQLSFFFMLFQVEDNGILKSISIDHQPDFEDDLSVRLKYNGKTNETITRMMMNLALASSDFAHEEHPKMLDPLCGRGTTLFEGMISGYDVYGVDKDQKSVAELGTYITRYVKEARLKHTNKRGKLIHLGKHTGDLFELQYAKEKSDYKSGLLRELKVVRGDTTNFDGAFRQKYMHLIVADFPYNVQHSAKSGDGNGLSWLLDAGLKSWTPFLKKGGAIAISWNIYTDKRASLIQIFEEHGYEVMNDYGLNELEHRVSQAITRDIIIARKK